MNIKFLLPALSAGVLLFASSCKEETLLNNEATNEKASLHVKLAGEGITTRAEATDAEMEVHNYSIYVFYANGTLETVATNESSITGLTPGSKTIAVIANAPAGFAPGSITSLSTFEDANFDLDTQYPRTLDNGLVMSGSTPETLASGSNSAEVTVSRLVAKVKLGSINILPSAGHDPAKFELVGVHMMKVKSKAKIGAPNVLGGVDFYGGADPVAAGLPLESLYKNYLTETAAEGVNAAYFYVYPNDENDATLMTIEGRYDGQTTYFPFVINNTEISAGDGTGDYIKRNTLHTVNVTLKKLGGGVENPEEVVDPAAVDVTITAEDWVIIPEQGVEW